MDSFCNLFNQSSNILPLSFEPEMFSESMVYATDMTSGLKQISKIFTG